ncbi:SPS2 [Symbiodinium pilosum]|uniref:SPS2 protein n=1 Tax=Symbiodinium pilosum TaxID=2952 RepID=A0A812P8H9_SYMPI|nr:SPS2 [Symbiodinium pilosum]
MVSISALAGRVLDLPAVFRPTKKHCAVLWNGPGDARVVIVAFTPRAHDGVHGGGAPRDTAPSKKELCAADSISSLALVLLSSPFGFVKSLELLPEEPWSAVAGKAGKDSVIVTDLIAQSFIKIFNNAFLNTIERVREPHLLNVLANLRNFAARVPSKYRGSIEKALKTEGFLSFLLSRAAVSLLCAKATLPPQCEPKISKEHEELATVVEELYIAAMLHAEDQWDLELKADGKTFMAVATSFVKHLADPAPLKAPNIQAALLGLDANPLIWTRYGLDLLGISLDLSLSSYQGATSSQAADRRKVSLLGGDSLYATAQWAMAKLHSRPCRKLIAKTIASYSDGQLRKRELLWNLDLTVKQYLEIEQVAGVAAFFGASTACAAFVNNVSDDIAQQMAEFGSDIGLVVGLLKDVRTVGMRSALKLGRISAPIIFAMQKDPRLRELLSSRLSQGASDFEEALRRVKESGMMPTIRLVNKLGARAAARLECLEESEEKEALLTLVRGVACLPLMEQSGSEAVDDLTGPEDESDAQSRIFDMKVANLRLRAELQRIRSCEQRSRDRLESIQQVARGLELRAPARPSPKGLGLEFDSQEIEWLLMRGLERRAPLPEQLDLESLLSCISDGQEEVQRRLLGLSDAAQSQKLKYAVQEVFSSGGKRLRPALCLLVHSMLDDSAAASQRRSVYAQTAAVPGQGAAYNKVLVLATAIEIIHTASLVHDDILDDADTRRQQQTMHRIFGPDVAVLSGDFLFAHASGLIESLEDDEVTRLVSLVIEEFGYGELSQSAKRFDTQVSLFNYLKKSFYKTASLLAAACRASAVLTGPPGEVCDVLYSYGFYLGLAFQIADDVLDFVGGEEELGKPTGQDLREGNLTAPVILCLHGNEDLGMTPAAGSKELARIIQRRFCQTGDLERALQLIDEGGGVQRAYALAEKMANKALEALSLVAPADTDARRALAGLTRWAVRRSS